MRLVIDDSDLLTRRSLTVRERGVRIRGFTFWGARFIPFERIDLVLRSSNHQLSLQAGLEVYKFATRPNKSRHQATIAALLERLARTAPLTAPPPTPTP